MALARCSTFVQGSTLPVLLGTSLLFLMLPIALADDAPAIADNGREVVLREDGTWEFVSEDRFATTADGKRIRLKGDGTWEPADQSDAERYGFSQSGGFSRDAVELDDLSLRLGDVVIETVRTRRGKNPIEQSQMVFQVVHDGELPPELSSDLYVVSDSRGREYETASITVSPDGAIEVRTTDSPGFMWAIKHFRLTIAPEAFGTREPVVLTKVKGEVLDREVDALSPGAVQ